jgi:hypothetical protein
VTLAANTAITPVGRARIWDESAILDELWKSFPEKYVPRVYFGESVRLGSGEPVDVFFTEWLEGYHEFHWSKPDTGPECVALWTDGGIVNLGPAETSSLYRNCAAVLAYYLDIATFKEIYDWRHEAGDFVASLGSENAPVKLIAARRYDTRIVFTDEITEPDTFPAAVWIMETSMRMRLDRLDGVGAFFLAPVEYIRPCLEGIFTTWAQKPVHTGAGPEFARRVLARVQSMPLEEIAEIFSAVFEGCHPDAADIGLIDRAMPEHVVRFVEETKRLRV